MGRGRLVLGASAVGFVAAGAIGAVLLAAAGGPGDDGAGNRAARQAEVERRGASVMPFDQDQTMHRFRKTAEGGVQTVTADDPNDSTQVRLVREHLAYERDRFAAGDFTDPTAIHGAAMPGIDDLRRGAAAGRLTVAYAARPDGARLTYSTDDPELVDALHAWFDAQLLDHGSHAMG
jgi:hypothetical protein